MTSWKDINNPMSIAFIAYSCVTSIALVLLFFYVKKLKANVKCSHCYVDEGKPEDLEHLNSTVIDTEHGNDTISRRLYRTRSVPISPNKPKRFSEYDSVACISRPAPEIDHPAVVHHYEEMRDPQRGKGNQCNVILEDVSTALTTATRDNCENNDLYKSFLEVLLRNIKMKDLDLYESIQCDRPKHTYEKIHEVQKSKLNVNFERNSGDESTYAIYVPSLSGKLVNVVNSNECSGKESSNDSSDDGLERFQERRRPDENAPSEVRRLRAKEESAKLSCCQDSLTRRTYQLPSASANEVQIPATYEDSSTISSSWTGSPDPTGLKSAGDSLTRRTDQLPSASANGVQILATYEDSSTIPNSWTGSPDPTGLRYAGLDRVRNSQVPPELPPKMSRRQLNRSCEDML